MKDNSTITELSVLNENDTIFSQGKYIIPLYQRAFAWREKEINQLIDDICNFESEQYYLGSLIVDKKSDVVYEVIDGQQRLTALYLLLSYLGKSLPKESLTYECRDNSNFTLEHLPELRDENKEDFQTNHYKEIEYGLIVGLEHIESIFNGEIKQSKAGTCGRTIDRTEFLEKLKKVLLYRIEVPENTDLNRYFEIMNVRGEQLEQQDIIKEKLMSQLDDDEKRAFATVWDACRNMSGYVQMHFNTMQRKSLFGDYWNTLNLDRIFHIAKEDSESINDAQKVIDIINGDEPKPMADGEDETSGKIIRFNSIISFPHFLLHVLNVLTKKERDNENYSLDDQKLLKTFESAIDSNSDKKKEFSRSFIKCLLKCRFLYDKYIIKREYKAEEVTDDNHGKWILRELTANNGKPKYNDTTLKNKGEWKSTYVKAKETRHSRILMLQACLRVSVTSPRAMHWITRLLTWLYDDENVMKISRMETEIENFIVGNEDMREFISGDCYAGVATPHLAFNYLDYLLWRDHQDKYKDLHFDDFVFEFRNSVEHWYPQHPSGENKWDDKTSDKYNRDFFGNLCLITRSVNSRFSDLPPIAKRDAKKDVDNNSLKLRIMSKKTNDNNEWRTSGYKQHGEKMLEILRKACNTESVPNMG